MMNGDIHKHYDTQPVSMAVGSKCRGCGKALRGINRFTDSGMCISCEDADWSGLSVERKDITRP